MPVALRVPGWWRALEFTILGVAFSYAITIGLRALFGYEPLVDGEAVLRVGLLTTPMFFLVGLGCFDYWFYWASGRPTRPEDHSGHGAYSWKDYFRPNTDHKVIAPGYQPNIMPPNFGDTLSAEQVDALVKYLSTVTNK